MIREKGRRPLLIKSQHWPAAYGGNCNIWWWDSLIYLTGRIILNNLFWIERFPVATFSKKMVARGISRVKGSITPVEKFDVVRRHRIFTQNQDDALSIRKIGITGVIISRFFGSHLSDATDKTDFCQAAGI